MTIAKIYAASARNLDKSQKWYARLIGRPSDLHPMAEVHEWHFGNGRDFATIAQLTDPDGNQITLAQLGPVQVGVSS